MLRHEFNEDKMDNVHSAQVMNDRIPIFRVGNNHICAIDYEEEEGLKGYDISCCPFVAHKHGKEIKYISICLYDIDANIVANVGLTLDGAKELIKVIQTAIDISEKKIILSND